MVLMDNNNYMKNIWICLYSRLSKILKPKNFSLLSPFSHWKHELP